MTAKYMASTSVKYDDWLKNFDLVENKFADNKKIWDNGISMIINAKRHSLGKICSYKGER